MQKVNESHAQKNLIFEGEEQSDEGSNGYDYSYSSYESGSKEQSSTQGCDSYDPSITGSGSNSYSSSRFAGSNFSSETEIQNNESLRSYSRSTANFEVCRSVPDEREYSCSQSNGTFIVNPKTTMQDDSLDESVSRTEF